MGNHIATGPARRLGTPSLVAAFLTASLIAGCDSGPAELAREIDAAREGCTEEMLKAGDEECVRMFETYADMAADAMETYIGGMRAFDEAIQRRGGLQFDTAGLGNALGNGRRGELGPIDGQSLPYATGRGADATRSGYDPLTDPYAADPYGSATGGRWSDPVPAGGISAQTYPGAGANAAGAAASAQSPGRPAGARRGVLLPPEERLRRPWLDDAGVADPYVEEVPPRDAARSPTGQAGGWYSYPNPAPNGYQGPYGTPGGYPPPYGISGGYSSPYGMPGAYPYPYGAPGGYPYPYPGAGPGVGYPYPDPALGEYPYPDDRRGGR